jgi:serine/threonine protein kinase
MHEKNTRPAALGQTINRWVQCPTCAAQLPSSTKFCPHDSTPLFDSQYEPVVPNYKIIKLLGSGGMGDVYEAEHLVLRKRVAIKTLKAHLQDSNAYMRFQSEAQAAGRLKHPNIVGVYDCGISQTGEPYMVMDKVVGATLSQLLETEGTLKVEESLDIVLQICEGVRCAHDNGILHRDLKPSNVILEVDGGKVTARVLDFGIAKILSNEGPTMNLTRTGELFGTPSYMSPEQSNGEKVDQRSDIYSIGCILYEVLTGQPPFIGKSAMEVMIKHMTEAPLPLSEAALKKFPPGLESIVARAIAKKPAERFGTISELINAIKDFQNGVVSPAVENNRAAPGKPKLKDPVFLTSLVGGVLSLILVVGLVAWCLSSEQKAVVATSDVQSSTPIAGSHESEAVKPEVVSSADTHLPHDAQVTKSTTASGADDEEFKRYLIDHPFQPKLAPGLREITNAALPGLTNRPNLEVLDLDGCQEITDDGLAYLSNSKNLSELKLPGCSQITEKGLKHIANLPSLHLLNLAHTAVGDDVLKVVGKLPLFHLDLSHTKITDKAFDSINPNSPITVLHLKDTKVTDQGLDRIARLKHLLTLNLDGCLAVGDVGLKHLCKSDIDQLSLRKTAVSDKGIDYLAQMKKLRHLYLDETQIDASGLKRLASLDRLTLLQVSGSNGITQADVHDFREHSHCSIKFTP